MAGEEGFETFDLLIQATVTFTYTEGGYDIDLTTGQPLESSVIAPAQRVTVELEQRSGSWLVDRYESDG